MNIGILFRNTGRLLAAGVLSQLLSLSILPVLTRLYSPTDFGVVSVLLMGGGLLQIAMSRRIEYSVARQSDPQLALGMRLLGSKRILIFSVASFPVLFFAYLLLTETANLIWIPLIIFLGASGALFQIFLFECLRLGRTDIQMRAALVQVAAASIFQVIAGIFAGSGIVFVLGTCIGYVVGCFYCWLRTGHGPWFRRKIPDQKKLELLAADDAGNGAAHSALFLVSRSFAAPAIGFFGAMALAGSFSVAQRMVFNPLLITINAAGRAGLHWFANQGEGEREAVAAYLALINASVIAAIGLSSIGLIVIEPLMLAVLGSEWTPAAAISKGLLLVVPGVIGYELLSSLLVAKNTQRQVLETRVIGLLLGGVAILLLALDFSTDLMLGAYFAAMIVNNVVGTWRGLRSLNCSSRYLPVAVAIGTLGLTACHFALSSNFVPSAWVAASVGFALIFISSIRFAKLRRGAPTGYPSR